MHRALTETPARKRGECTPPASYLGCSAVWSSPPSSSAASQAAQCTPVRCPWHALPCVSVKVYVMLHQRSPHVLCVTQRLRNSELIDPLFQWHGPKGKVISGRRSRGPAGSVSLSYTEKKRSVCVLYV